MQLVPMRVMHSRQRPAANAFVYRMNYIAISLDEIERCHRSVLFAVDAPAPFSLRSRDYGSGNLAPGEWIRSLAARFAPQADGRIVLLTAPRVLGLGFNPVSFWFCFDRAERVRAVIAEVNNTFGERHFYFCAHPDARPLDAQFSIERAKEFRVSPFLEVNGRYRFRFSFSQKDIGIFIDLVDDEGAVALSTSMTGKPLLFGDKALVASLCRSPLQGIKAVVLIHFQALRLYFKGVRHVRKPPAAGRIPTA